MQFVLGNTNDEEISAELRRDAPPETYNESLSLEVKLRQILGFAHSLDFLERDFYLVDCGGTGDCFIRAFNYAHNKLFGRDMVSPESWYTLFNLPTSEFLEAEHVSTIASYYKVTVCVLRTVSDEIMMQLYGDNVEYPWIYVYNQYPFHYYAICFESASSEEESEEEEESGQDDSQSDTSNETETNLLDPLLKTRPEFKLIVSYLINSENFQFSTVEVCLRAFQILHYEVVLTVHALVQENRVPAPDFFKLYYKFRHNVFSFICQNAIKKTTFFGTDVPLSKYIPSKKTPDFIWETGTEIHIFEFTVSNRYDVADFNKGGGNRPVKYDQEARQVQESTGLLTKVRIVSAILNEYNIDEISNDMFPHTLDLDQLTEFFDICNQNRNIINTCQLKATYVKELPRLETDITAYDRPPVPHTLMLPPEMLESLLKAVSKFKAATSMILVKSRHKQLKVCYDLATGGTYIQYEKKCKPPITGGEFLAGLGQGGLNYLLSILHLLREGVKVQWSDLRGSVPVTVARSEELYLKKMEAPVYVGLNLYFQTDWESPEYENLKQHGFLQMSRGADVYFPDNYFETLCKHDFNNIMHSKSKKLLYNCRFESSDLEECMEIFKEMQTEKNQQINFVKSPKPTFFLPILNDVSPMAPTGSSLLSDLVTSCTGYTGEILMKAHSGQYAPTRDITESRTEVNALKDRLNAANVLLYNKMKEHNLLAKGKKLSPAERVLLQPLNNAVQAARKEYTGFLSTLKGTRNEHLVRLPHGKGGRNAILFKQEMAHYNADKSVFKGIGEIDKFRYEMLNNSVHKFILSLSKEVDMPIIPLFNSQRSAGPELLTNLKNMYTERAQQFAQQHFLGKRIDAICTFYSKIAVHLFNESTKTYNSSFIKVDTLGYGKVLVLVRGGSKIYKHQVSRLFKIFCVLDPDEAEFLGYRENRNYKIHNLNSGCVVETPWAQLHQDVLFDYMSLRERTFMNLFSAHTRITAGIDGPLRPLTLMPFVLSLHNRRKTETFMHNSRYLIVNPLAMHANLQGLIGSFAGFNYSLLEAWLRKRLEYGYAKFAGQMMKAKGLKGARIDSVLSTGDMRDLWLDSPIENADQLTNFIYITYMMTKAPVNSSLEQANNLWEILDDVKSYSQSHSDVSGLSDVSQRFSILTDSDEVYEDDFKYDPVFCNYLGHHLLGFLRNTTTPVEVANRWETLKTQDLSTIANSNGLRGWNKQNFFNKKGYEVVFSKIDEILSNSDHTLQDLITKYLSADPGTSQQMINDDKVNLETAEKNLIFHVVHKIQRGGGREIFCMDVDTKSRQNPIEKMMKFLCKMIPNEYISIPSNKRHGLIHSDFYEKKINRETNFVYRWVLDCRRWAPHSVFQKYVYFIEGLSPLLPADFIIEFRSFADQMYKKLFLTREHVYKKLVNNIRFAEYKDLVKVSNVISGAYEITVSFSFVMGIFNYLSTLMHAANQIVAGEVIRNQCLFRGQGLAILDPKCHSDDSVVSSYHSKQESLKTSLILYDWLLKGSNHMLSIKKSQVNADVYLEFLSVLYLFDRFLPVLPKFSSSLPFKPSDKGYSSDISFAVTQCIEMLSQGGSYEESFIMMKTTERFVQNCYRINFVSELPYQILGIIDSHPIELLYAGGMSDLYRSMVYDPKSFWRGLKLLDGMGIVDTDKGDVSLRWDMSSKITGGPRNMINKYGPIIETLEDDCSWTVSNLKLGNGFLNLLWYVNKLRDRMFYSSLVEEPVARRFARMFGSGSYRDLVNNEGQRFSVTRVGLILSEYISADSSFEEDHVLREFMNFCCRDLQYFYRSIEGATISKVEEANQKEKPVVFYQGLPILGNIEISAAEYVSYTREPKGYQLLGKRSNPVRECSKITTQLNLMGVDVDLLSKDQLYAVARKVTKDEQRSFRLVMPMPGDERRVDGYTDAVKTLIYNSFKWKRILIRAKNTSAIDWSRRMVSGKMPQSITDFLQLYWFEKVCEKYDVRRFDIFKDYDSLEVLRARIPDEWKPVINAELDPSKYLIDMPYWCCWTKEQVKLGKNWYGSGECFISLPEVMLKLTIVSGRIRNIEMETDHFGPLSTASNWYLNVFFYYSGLTADIAPRDFGDPSSMYLGQDDNGTFKIGRPGVFSQIYLDSKIGVSLSPAFARRQLNYKQNGSQVVYYDGLREYKVNFFIPLDQPVLLDLAQYIDTEKLRALLTTEPDLNSFVQEYATSVLGHSRKDLSFLKRNIDSSLIYNIIYNYTDKSQVFEGLRGDMPLISAIREWKGNHPGFGFPSDDSLAILAKSGDVAPLSAKMIDFVKKLGMTEMNKIEFDMVMAKVLSMPPGDREHYLVNMYPHLLGEQQAGSLVVLRKSTRIFTSCAFVREKQYSLLVDFLYTLADALESSGIVSNQIEQWASSIHTSSGTRVDQKDFLLSVLAQFFVSCCQGDTGYASHYQSAGLLYDILRELLEKGISVWLNIASASSPVFRSVEFCNADDEILNWFIDLLDNCTLSSGINPNKPLSYQQLVGEARGKLREGRFLNEWGKLRKYISRIDFFRPKEELVLMRKSKIKKDRYGFNIPRKTDQKILELCDELIPGIAVEKFLPLDEEWQEEYDISWEYEDQFEDYLRDEDADIPRTAYVYSADLSIKNLTRLRGTAWNLYISFTHLNPDILMSADTLTFFEPEDYKVPKNLYNFILEPPYLCRVGSKQTQWSVQGYKKMPWEKVRALMREKIETDHMMEIQGETHTKRDVISDPSLTQHIPTLDSYFKRLTSQQAVEVVVENQAVIDFASTNLFLSPEFEEEKKALDAKLLAFKKEHLSTKKESKDEPETQPVVVDIENPENNQDLAAMLFGILSEQQHSLDEIGTSVEQGGSGGAALLERGTTQYSFKEPTDLLTDAGFKSEFETLFPGFWNSMNLKEISLTKNQKNDRLALARSKIKRMSGEEKRNYTMLYQVLMFILNELPEKGGIPNISNSFMLHVDGLFDLDIECTESEGLISFNQLHARPIMLIPEDVDLL
nr:MAG: RNA-dependent RNA polymerase [Sanya bunya-like virus 2]